MHNANSLDVACRNFDVAYRHFRCGVRHFEVALIDFSLLKRLLPHVLVCVSLSVSEAACGSWAVFRKSREARVAKTVLVR